MDDLTALLTRPVVLALKLFLSDGVLSPNFILLPLCAVCCVGLSITHKFGYVCTWDVMPNSRLTYSQR